jgi:2',3'-cyclic-nucleotide 2'-phosphodiesterase (5'-nucleotidase family)
LDKIMKKITKSALLAAVILFAISFDAGAQTATQTAPAAAPQRYEVHTGQQQIDEKIPEDKAVSDMVATYAAGIKDKMNTVIGFAPRTINKQGKAGGALAVLISQIVKQAATTTGQKVQVGIMNVHGIRVDEIPAGQVTIGLIYRLLPFENEVATIKMTGADLFALLAEMTPDNRDTAVLSGAKVIYSNGKLRRVMIGNKRIRMKATYTVGITDYLYSRGGEYSILQRGKDYKAVGVTLRDAIIDYIREEHTAGRQLVATTKDWLIIQ